jgi:hypothetical protein
MAVPVKHVSGYRKQKTTQILHSKDFAKGRESEETQSIQDDQTQVAVARPEIRRVAPIIVPATNDRV